MCFFDTEEHNKHETAMYEMHVVGYQTDNFQDLLYNGRTIQNALDYTY